MKTHVVFIVVLIWIAGINSNPVLEDELEKKGLENSEVKIRHRRDDDYDDEGGFVLNQGKPGDDDFIANAPHCPAGYLRTPWGNCVTCNEYRAKGLGNC